MSIQEDLEEISAMEAKIALETSKIENELRRQFEEEEYVEARRILLISLNSLQRMWQN